MQIINIYMFKYTYIHACVCVCVHEAPQVDIINIYQVAIQL